MSKCSCTPAGVSRSTMYTLPDMPRCTMAVPSEVLSKRYLARLSTEAWEQGRREPMTDDVRRRIEEANERLANSGMRVLGLALRTARRTDRSLLLHLAYLAEAALLYRWLRQRLSEKYGWRDRWVSLYVDQERSLAVRLALGRDNPKQPTE